MRIPAGVAEIGPYMQSTAACGWKRWNSRPGSARPPLGKAFSKAERRLRQNSLRTSKVTLNVRGRGLPRARTSQGRGSLGRPRGNLCGRVPGKRSRTGHVSVHAAAGWGRCVCSACGVVGRSAEANALFFARERAAREIWSGNYKF